MKLAILAAALFLAAMPAAAAEPAGPEAPDPADWQLFWSDEFDGPEGSAPDREKWTVRVIPNPANNELQHYTDRPENVALDGRGRLVITARRERFGNRRYTSGRLDTTGKLDIAYGRFEARLRLPRGQGIWPAFWLLGSDYPEVGWPRCGELDIMENIGREPAVVHGTLHGPGYSGGGGIGGARRLERGRYADDFHLFAAEWDPEEIRWYVDGELFQTRRPEDLGARAWAFDHEFYIILNLAVGGDWPGPPDAGTEFPQEFLVDYVRVYRRPPGHPAAAPPPRAEPATPNLARGRPATASSRENDALGPALAVDGDPGTRWSSAFSDPQWLRIDLGEVREIRRVVLRWEAASARAYRLELSPDGETWTTLHATAEGPGGREELAVSGRGRYLRLTGTRRATPYGYSLWELEAYGPDPAPPPPAAAE